MRGCFVLVSNGNGWEENFPSIGTAEAALRLPASVIRRYAKTSEKIRTLLGTVEIVIQKLSKEG